MIEMDMALETELGVDSIKRVEILSEVQKQLSVEAQDVAALSRTQTVGEVVDAMIKELGSCAAAPPAAVSSVAPPVASAAAPSGGVSADEATKVVLSVLAAKTGYEVDMIEMDMALETELGVDSIKRVEILSEVQKQLSVEAQDVAALSRTQTLGEVVDAMIKELGAPTTAPAASSAPSSLPHSSRASRTCAVGTAKTSVGHVGYASGAAALIKASLCLYHRYLPVMPRWKAPAPRVAGTMADSSLYVCSTSHGWTKNAGGTRRAAVSGVATSSPGSKFHVLLSDGGECFEPHSVVSLDPAAPKLLTIRAATPEAVQAAVFASSERIVASGSDAAVASAAAVEFASLLESTVESTVGTGTAQFVLPEFVLCLVTSPTKLLKELELAAKSILLAVANGKDYTSPAGSYFTPAPLRSDRVAFVYGDGSSPYPGLGGGMHRLAPGTHEFVQRATTDMWTNSDEVWHPRAVDAAELKAKEKEMPSQQVELFRSGVYHSTCFTAIAREVLGIKPRAAFGLSMGEVAMLFAFDERNSKTSNQMIERLHSSPVWTSQLAMKFDALRAAWGVAADAPISSFWSGYLLHSTRDAVLAGIERLGGKSAHVRLIIVNDAHTCIIGGKPQVCDALIGMLRCDSTPIHQGMVGHCVEVAPFAGEIARIHDCIVLPDGPNADGVEFFSSAGPEPFSLASKAGTALTELIGELYTGLADFPRLVETVYASKYDVFVELGAGDTRTAAVKDILAGKPHVAVAFDKKGQSPWRQLLRMCAVLISHGNTGCQVRKLYHPELLSNAKRVASKLPPTRAEKLCRSITVNGRFLSNSVMKSGKLDGADDRLMTLMKRVPTSKTDLVSKDVVLVPSAATAIQPPIAPSTQPSADGLPKVSVTDSDSLRMALLDAERDIVVTLPGGGSGLVRSVPWSRLGAGAAAFMDMYGVKYPLYTGAMAKGIASAELVIAAGLKGMLASLGAGGLPLDKVSQFLDQIQAQLPNGPYAVNLIHSPFDEGLEEGGVDLFLKRGVRVVEASAFMKLTANIVRFRVAGLEPGPAGGPPVCRNKVIFKVSRTELAEMAMRPPPADLVDKCLRAGHITPQQAALAPFVTMCDDVAVEADSGGHTDNRPMPVLLPVIIATRDAIAAETGMRVRVGAGGGIGCPEAAAAAFAMGADFVVTGTINQMSRQAGTCDKVRKQLSEAAYSDITMAPAADMFDAGVELQVLSKGTMFPARAKKLYDLFVSYPSLEAIPAEMRTRLEQKTFGKPIAAVWEETVKFHIERLKDPKKIELAERDPKLKMSLVFRWYLSKSSGWANRGEGRPLDYQVWCGPAIGSFNKFIKGTYLDSTVANEFHDVHEGNVQVLQGARVAMRCAQLQADPRLRAAVSADVLRPYRPSQPLSSALPRELELD